MKARPQPSTTLVYLWLNCEGWVRFGPFQWLQFDANPPRICDQDGQVIATHDGTDWRTEHDAYRNYRWRTPMVTATSRHPHPSRG